MCVSDLENGRVARGVKVPAPSSTNGTSRCLLAFLSRPSFLSVLKSAPRESRVRSESSAGTDEQPLQKSRNTWLSRVIPCQCVKLQRTPYH
jgi:hypothetical protein